MQLHLNITGILLVGLGLVHSIFPRYFNWTTELNSLSLINRQMMYVHTLFIALMVFMMGILCLSMSEDLLQTQLGQNISFGLGLFWTVRLLVQLFGYSSELWKKKRFETGIHILFIFLWTYISVVFFSIYLQ
jgi:hypothetical protein